MNGQDETAGREHGSWECNPPVRMAPAKAQGVKTEDVYNVLQAVKTVAEDIYSMQVSINEKLINCPMDIDNRKEPAMPEKVVNPAHLPAFADMGELILGRLKAALSLQVYLNSHI